MQCIALHGKADSAVTRLMSGAARELPVQEAYTVGSVHVQAECFRTVGRARRLARAPAEGRMRSAKEPVVFRGRGVSETARWLRQDPPWSVDRHIAGARCEGEALANRHGPARLLKVNWDSVVRKVAGAARRAHMGSG